MKVRARDLGIPFEGQPGPLNSITDVPGVEVGHTTLVSGEGSLVVGEGPVRTGVTAILPRGKKFDPVFASWYSLNGNGEMTGTTWVDESGFLETPILLTNTHSVGVVRDATIAWVFQNRLYDTSAPAFWSLPVVTETADGRLNDMNGFHVRAEHVASALESASTTCVDEGSVGGGTGMVCFQFKGGIGTASRQVESQGQSYCLGALAQTNFGLREHLTIAGAPVGRELTGWMPVFNQPDRHPESGSVVVVIATDAPLLPHQLRRLCRRVALGIGKVGGIGANTSGDIFLAFSTANSGAYRRTEVSHLEMLSNDEMNPFLEATIQTTEEAIINSMVAAQTMAGINHSQVFALPHDELRAALRKYNRLAS